MKALVISSLVLAFTLASCSTCYECDTDVVLTDANQNPIDTTQTTDEFCTSDASEVTARENDGATCRVQ